MYESGHRKATAGDFSTFVAFADLKICDRSPSTYCNPSTGECLVEPHFAFYGTMEFLSSQTEKTPAPASLSYSGVNGAELQHDGSAILPWRAWT